jgi:hypothetical protein
LHLKYLLANNQMPQTHLWPEEIVEEGDLLTLSMTIELADGTRTRLWYRLPAQYRDLLTSSCDPFVIATTFLSMSQGTEVLVHGQVSPSLLQNLEEFQAIWSSWRPQEYKMVKISADREKEQPAAGGKERAISTFSGGVDSCFTAFRHQTGRCGRQKRNLQAGLMVHGFDIPLRDNAFEGAMQKSRLMLSSLAMECIPIATNFRQVVKLNWEDIFGTGIASCLHVLKGGYTTGMIASSHAYHTLNFVYGSNPLTDRLLSSQYFEIVHDGALVTRLEKMQYLLDWPEALENLRVCWQGGQKDRNCGRCEKCVRNILNFRILGADLPACFEQDITDQQIAQMIAKGYTLEIWQNLLANAKTANLSASWVKAVEKAISRSQLRAIVESLAPKNLTPWLKSMEVFLIKKGLLK